MQDFGHQPYVLETSFLKPSILGPTLVSPKRGPEPWTVNPKFETLCFKYWALNFKPWAANPSTQILPSFDLAKPTMKRVRFLTSMDRMFTLQVSSRCNFLKITQLPLRSSSKASVWSSGTLIAHKGCLVLGWSSNSRKDLSRWSGWIHKSSRWHLCQPLAECGKNLKPLRSPKPSKKPNTPNLKP